MKIVFPTIENFWLALPLLLFLTWLPSSVSAFDAAKPFSQYKQIVWNTENGLPQNLVMTTTQTKDGYMWFGTQEGLARFNGASFKIFDAATAPTLKLRRKRGFDESTHPRDGRRRRRRFIDRNRRRFVSFARQRIRAVQNRRQPRRKCDSGDLS